MADQQLKLYSYFRSSCSFRVRIALNQVYPFLFNFQLPIHYCYLNFEFEFELIGLKYEYKAVNLSKGEQFSPEFRKLNPIGYVPVLVDGVVIAVSDSFSILIYLEEKYPQCPLLPNDLQLKAINFQAANIVSSSIQPFQNLAGLKYVEEKVSQDAKDELAKVHMGKGFAALEDLLKKYAGKYATGDEVSFADLFLAPQIYAAFTWFNLDMTQFPLLSRLHQAYNEIPAFVDARPDMQPDAPA